jgi:hypothetical protein
VVLAPAGVRAAALVPAEVDLLAAVGVDESLLWFRVLGEARSAK